MDLARVWDSKPETARDALPMYRRACVLGEANGCTNAAASVWAREHSEEESSCALRVFEKACAASEHFACGMVARLRLEGKSADREAIHDGLVRHCDALGGFPCRVLAKHLEAGDFGSYEPRQIAKLLERACEGGDPDGCGHPATAEETFD